MPSANPSRSSTVQVFSASVVAAATVAGFVAYFTGAVRFNDIDVTGNLQATAITGSTLDITGTMSGKTLSVESETGTASGYVVIEGSNSGVTGSGGVLCIEDNDGAGFSLLSCLNGTCTARAAAANECPTG